MKKLAFWQFLTLVKGSTLVESQCSSSRENGSCSLNCTSRIYEKYLGDCSQNKLVNVVEICNSSRCSLLENKNITRSGSTIVQSTCSTVNSTNCELICSSRSYDYQNSGSCSGDVFVTEICDINADCEILYSRPVTHDIVECTVITVAAEEELDCDGKSFSVDDSWDLFFPCFYYRKSGEIYCEKKIYANTIR
mgnify:CR=1 FL=1